MRGDEKHSYSWNSARLEFKVWGKGAGTRAGVKVVVAVWLLSRVWLFCDPVDCSLLGSSTREISQARILAWVAIFFSRVKIWLWGAKRQIEKNPDQLEAGVSSTDKDVGGESTKEFWSEKWHDQVQILEISCNYWKLMWFQVVSMNEEDSRFKENCSQDETCKCHLVFCQGHFGSDENLRELEQRTHLKDPMGTSLVVQW